MSAERFTVAYAALNASHQVGDHWLQTAHQAAIKDHRGWAGRRACAGHVATYTATQALAVTLTSRAAGVRLAGPRLAAGLAVSAVSHYWADRRFTLARLADRLGQSGLYTLGTPRAGHDDNPSLGTGAYALDQSWHQGWLLVAALVIGGGQ